MWHFTVKTGDNVVGTEAHNSKWKPTPLLHLSMLTDTLNTKILSPGLVYSMCQRVWVTVCSTICRLSSLWAGPGQIIRMASRDPNTNSVIRTDFHYYYDTNRWLSPDSLCITQPFSRLVFIFSHQNRQTFSFLPEVQDRVRNRSTKFLIN